MFDNAQSTKGSILILSFGSANTIMTGEELANQRQIEADIERIEREMEPEYIATPHDPALLSPATVMSEAEYKDELNARHAVATNDYLN